MPKNKDKGRIEGPFTPLLIATMDAPAWRQLSHGAVRVYIGLKRRVPKYRNTSRCVTERSESNDDGDWRVCSNLPTR
jgi:hypothetical protein